MKNKILLGLLFASTIALGQSQNSVGKDYNKGHSLSTNGQIIEAYNAPARINPVGKWDIDLSASFIYWQAREHGLEMGVSITADPSTDYGHIINMNFDYHPGFKVGLGTNFPSHDNWTIFGEYTRLYLSDKVSSDAPSGGSITPTWWYQSGVTRSASRGASHWKLDLNILDIEIARPYYVGTKLTFSPLFGGRATFINQKLNSNYYITSESATVYSRNKSKAWSLGPRLGLDTNWFLSKNFKIVGNTAFALMYQHFTAKCKLDDATTGTGSLHKHTQNSTGLLFPSFELTPGISWGSYCYNNKLHFDILLAYEFHYLWNQNQPSHNFDISTFAVDGVTGDLMLHGATLTLKFDF